ncbi:MAG: hypothetical protein RR253_04665, partial [Oscillospiraceae bacterium]
MKKIWIISFLIFFMVCPIKVGAEGDYKSQIDKIAKEEQIDTTNILSIGVKEIFEYFKNQVEDKAAAPLSMFYRVSAIIILCSVVKLFEGNVNGGISEIINSLCVLTVFINLLTPFRNLIDMVSQSLINVKNFMATFLPIFGGISASSGEFLTSTIYTGFFLISLVFISNFCIVSILPTMNLYLAMTVTNSVSPGVRLKSLCDFYLKTVKLIMQGLVSIICFILTVQTTITQGQDNLTVKAGKVVVSRAVPIIGSALQDAIGSVYASMEAVKGFAGAVGILSIASIFLP